MTVKISRVYQRGVSDTLLPYSFANAPESWLETAVEDYVEKMLF